MGLNLSTDQLDALWDVVNTARTHSKTVRVPKEALVALVLDYGKMYAEITLTPDMREKRWRRRDD
jgi:hypothetical protein